MCSSSQLDSRCTYKLAKMAWSCCLCCNSMKSVDQLNLHSSKKCGVAVKTFSKRIADNDNTLNTLRWFNNYNKADRGHVARLICAQYVSSIMINKLCPSQYRLAYVISSTILQTFPFKKHMASDMHRMPIRSAQTMNITVYFVCTLAWRWGQLVRSTMKLVHMYKCTSLMISTCYPVGFNAYSIFLMLGQFNISISTTLSQPLC